VSVIPAKTRTAPTSAPASSPKAPPIVIAPENYTYLQQEIYRASGIVLDDDKYYLVESRLTPVARVAGLASLDGLCARLRAGSSPELGRKVIEALTTNETMFFRDVAPFEVLRERIIPELLERGPRKLAIWSAAASSGQEVYSIAMLLREMALVDPPVEILGTDLSERILERAREARYGQFEVNRGLPPQYLEKYFKREGLDWTLNDEIRHMVKFRRLDLRQPMSGLGKFDIVFCRNVLIYFDTETKVKILGQILDALNPGGYLLLGGAETTLKLEDKFERVVVASTAVYRKR